MLHFRKKIILITILLNFLACGSQKSNGDESVNVELNQTTELNATIETNQTIETNSTGEEISYSDEELTLSAYSRYITNNANPDSAKIVSLLFKGALPVHEGYAVIKENKAFSFELNWQNPEYAQNVSYYFFNGRQQGIAYLNFPLPQNSTSYAMSCQALTNFRFDCNGFVLDEAKNYEGESFPIKTSFVMAICDRNTKDPQRVCDFIRIPIELQ